MHIREGETLFWHAMWAGIALANLERNINHTSQPHSSGIKESHLVYILKSMISAVKDYLIGLLVDG